MPGLGRDILLQAAKHGKRPLVAFNYHPFPHKKNGIIPVVEERAVPDLARLQKAFRLLPGRDIDQHPLEDVSFLGNTEHCINDLPCSLQQVHLVTAQFALLHESFNQSLFISCTLVFEESAGPAQFLD